MPSDRESLLLRGRVLHDVPRASHVAPPKARCAAALVDLSHMFGAAHDRMRGEPWRKDLTVCTTHYQAQPMPNPLSWFFHGPPKWTRKGWRPVQ